MKLYPVMVDAREAADVRKAGWPIAVPYALVVEHEQWCRANHDQSADHLASRGGLSVGELAAVLTMRPLRWLRSPEATPENFVRIIREKVDTFNAREVTTLRAENERLRKEQASFIAEVATWIEQDDGRDVGDKSRDRIALAARFLSWARAALKGGCVAPNGRTDAHGVYGRMVDGVWTCEFCGRPGIPGAALKGGA